MILFSSVDHGSLYIWMLIISFWLSLFWVAWIRLGWQLWLFRCPVSNGSELTGSNGQVSVPPPWYLVFVYLLCVQGTLELLEKVFSDHSRRAFGSPMAARLDVPSVTVLKPSIWNWIWEVRFWIGPWLLQWWWIQGCPQQPKTMRITFCNKRQDPGSDSKPARVCSQNGHMRSWLQGDTLHKVNTAAKIVIKT